MWVMMVQHKTSDQYLTSGKVSTRSIHRFKRYRLLKTLTKNFNILSSADTDADTNTDADAVVTAIALPVLSYRRAKNRILVYKGMSGPPDRHLYWTLPRWVKLVCGLVGHSNEQWLAGRMCICSSLSELVSACMPADGYAMIVFVMDYKYLS